MTLPLETPDPLGLTLPQYAAARRTHPQAVRDDYRRLMRSGEGLALPPITRRIDETTGEGIVKFCLPVGLTADHPPTPPQPLESESVIIPMTSFHNKRWYSLCLSSQVGCRMACTFCETARMGLLHNLTAAQIVAQRLVARNIRQEGENCQLPIANCRSKNAPTAHQPNPPSANWQSAIGNRQYFHDGIQNLVFMGMGEPLDNFENVIQAIRVFTEPAGLNFPHAQITVSTVGRIDGLNRLADLCRAEPLWRNLRIAISLNAATDHLRSDLMPINKAMPLADLQRTLLAYPLPPKGRFLIEYVLIKDVNDSPADAAAIADFCRPLPCVVNLIPYNPQRYAAYETPADSAVLAFMTDLKSRGLFVKRRVTHGRQLMGACGQLGNPQVRRVPPRLARTARP